MSFCVSFSITPVKHCFTGYMLVKLRNVHYVLTICKPAVKSVSTTNLSNKKTKRNASILWK